LGTLVYVTSLGLLPRNSLAITINPESNVANSYAMSFLTHVRRGLVATAVNSLGWWRQERMRLCVENVVIKADVIWVIEGEI